MHVTQRRDLTPEDIDELKAAAERRDEAAAEYKRVVVKMLSRSSYGTMNRLTDLSPTTLGKWKRELAD